jgi:hypothetical protein
MMRKMKYNLLIPALLLFGIFSACDKIDPPYLQQRQTDTDDTSSTYKRMILVEEFTGQQCFNCPTTARLITKLMDSVYIGKLIPISFHAGGDAEPAPPTWPIDYTTSIGDQLYNDFGVQGTPAVAINRSYFNDEIIQYVDGWVSVIQYQLDSVVPYKLAINISSAYNEVSRQATIAVETEFLEDVSDELYLCVYVTEDSIVSKQQDSPSTFITNYVHRHVFRCAVNTGAYGEVILNGAAANKQKIVKNYSLNLDPGWNDDNCHIIAFIYADHGTTQGKVHKEVHQAAEAKVVE